LHKRGFDCYLIKWTPPFWKPVYKGHKLSKKRLLLKNETLRRRESVENSSIINKNANLTLLSKFLTSFGKKKPWRRVKEMLL
jgi:hypothetical protein